jgi:hypothetical protein
MKYIVETMSSFRHVHIVEAENEDEAFKIASVADDNWQEFTGQLRIDCQEYTEEHINLFRKKEYLWEGICIKDKDGYIAYIHPNGEIAESKQMKVPE